MGCRYCGKWFQGRSGNAGYCSDECRRRGRNRNRALKRRAGMAARVCDHCGVEMPMELTLKQRYCSVVCRSAESRARERFEPERHERHKRLQREWMGRFYSTDKGRAIQKERVRRSMARRAPAGGDAQ